MVRRGRHVETGYRYTFDDVLKRLKRYTQAPEGDVSDIEWRWAAAQIDDVVKLHLSRLNSTPYNALTQKEKDLLRSNVENAWKRILQG